MSILERHDLKKKAFAGLRSILSTVFSLAYQEYWITDNPYKRINFSQLKYANMILPDKSIADRAFTADEMDAILTFLHEKQKKEPLYFPAYALELQIIMGLRRGEIPPLRLVDIDHKRGFIEIRREMIVVKKSPDTPKEYAQIVDHTKTWKDRRYPLTDDLTGFLQRLYAVRERYRIESEFLFPANNKTGCISINTVYNFYRRMYRKLQIPIGRDLMRGPHAFRRNASTNVIEKSGGNIIMAAQLFGNSPEVLKKNYYTGLNMERARAILNA